MNAEELINKGKSLAQSGYDKGNGLMDKVPALKSKRNKLIAWGVIGAFAVVVMLGLFGGGPDPFEVARDTMVAIAEGDIETMFENLYWPEDVRENFSKLSDEEAEALEREMVKGFAEAYLAMSEEQRQFMIEAFSSMKCESVKTSGDEAKVTVKLRQISGDDATQSFTLRKYDGEWKLVMD